MRSSHLERYLNRGIEIMRREDPMLFGILDHEHQRQSRSLSLIASSGGTDPSVLATLGATIINVTAEGYPGKRYQSGCRYVDQVEQLAIDRAKKVFGARFANVQPHCASFANHTVMQAVLRPGDTLLGMALDQGGHLTHGASVNLSGRLYDVRSYGLNDQGMIDYASMRKLAHTHRPRLIICGTTSYSRTIDFPRVRAIADEVGAYVLADITHIAGLVATGEHPNPIDSAHFTTTCTFKQLYGPRGGLIMMGDSADMMSADGKLTLSQVIQRTVFPLMQGSPEVHSIAGKARALGRLLQPEFRELARRIRSNASTMARELQSRGYKVVSGGTDNHIVLFETPGDLNGDICMHALESCNILVNKNKVPGDTRAAMVTSGLRLGSNTVSLRGMGNEDMVTTVELIDRILRNIQTGPDGTFVVPDALRDDVIASVAALVIDHPLPYDMVPEVEYA